MTMQQITDSADARQPPGFEVFAWAACSVLAMLCFKHGAPAEANITRRSSRGVPMMAVESKLRKGNWKSGLNYMQIKSI